MVTTKTLKHTKKRAKEFSKSEAELLDVKDTFQYEISITEKEIAKNLAFLQKEKTQGTRTASGHLSSEGRPQGQQLSANSVNDDEAYHRADHRLLTRKHSRSRWDRPVLVKRFDTLKAVEDAHNTADWIHAVAKITVKSKDGRDSIRN